MTLIGICSATTPFLLLGDVLDCLPLDQCDKIFSFVEENVSTWKSVRYVSSHGITAHLLFYKIIVFILTSSCLFPLFPSEHVLLCREELLVADV